MDRPDCPPCPRKALFKKRRVPCKHSQSLGKLTGYDKNDLLVLKNKLQFEHDLDLNLKSFDKELHQQRLEQLRHLSEKLKDDAWMYPNLETTLGI